MTYIQRSKPGFFSEESGTPSMGRLMAFLSMMAMFGFGGIACFVPSARETGITMAMLAGGKSCVDKGTGVVKEVMKKP